MELDRALSCYDRNALAIGLARQGHEAQVTRHGVRLGRLEVLLGPLEELQGQQAAAGGFCPFPCFHLTVAEDWQCAEQLAQQRVRGCSETRWALDLAKRFSGEALPGMSLRGRSQKGAVVMELVLRELLLRIQERDEEALRRFRSALLGQGDQGHGLGSRLLEAMARELLEWSRSGLLGLWLKDAELFGGQRGKAQASKLLSAVALRLDTEAFEGFLGAKRVRSGPWGTP